jgi:hypothetical protein
LWLAKYVARMSHIWKNMFQKSEEKNPCGIHRLMYRYRLVMLKYILGKICEFLIGFNSLILWNSYIPNIFHKSLTLNHRPIAKQLNPIKNSHIFPKMYFNMTNLYLYISLCIPHGFFSSDFWNITINCSRWLFPLPVVLYFGKAHKCLKPSIPENVALREMKYLRDRI